jgi:hypothetical protein
MPHLDGNEDGHGRSLQYRQIGTMIDMETLVPSTTSAGRRLHPRSLGLGDALAMLPTSTVST